MSVLAIVVLALICFVLGAAFHSLVVYCEISPYCDVCLDEIEGQEYNACRACIKEAREDF